MFGGLWFKSQSLGQTALLLSKRPKTPHFPDAVKCCPALVWFRGWVEWGGHIGLWLCKYVCVNEQWKQKCFLSVSHWHFLFLLVNIYTQRSSDYSQKKEKKRRKKTQHGNLTRRIHLARIVLSSWWRLKLVPSGLTAKNTGLCKWKSFFFLFLVSLHSWYHERNTNNFCTLFKLYFSTS